MSDVATALGAGGAVVLDFLLRGTLVMLVALGAMAALRRRSAALRHFIGMVGILGLLALPLGMLILPADLALLPSLRSLLLGGGGSGGAPPVVPWGPIRAVLAVLWLAGGAFFLARFLRARRALQGFFRRARQPESLAQPLALAARALGAASSARLRVSPEVDVPLTFGLTTPQILLPAASASWTEERLEMVLLHELAHVRRLDMVNQCVCLAACCLYWFHPLVWALARRLDLERERACDDLVLGCRGDALVYARQLVDIAESLRGRPVSAFGVAMARPSQLRRRLTALLDAEADRRGTSLLQGAAAIALGAAVILPLGALASGEAATAPSMEERWEMEDGAGSEAMVGHGAEGHRSSGHQSSGHQASGHRPSGHRPSGHQSPGHQSSGHASGDHGGMMPLGGQGGPSGHGPSTHEGGR
jgi:beta-lactamase regulating signal transducer with metallopeptidase domain